MKNLTVFGFFFSLFLTATIPTYARGGISDGGGTGVVLGGRFAFLDLAHRAESLANAPHVASVRSAEKMSQLLLSQIQVTNTPGFHWLSGEARTRNDIALRRILRFAENETAWIGTNAALQPLQDAFLSDLDKEKNWNLVTIAIHRGNTVLVQSDLFNLLGESPIHQAALIVHETIRSMAASYGDDPQSQFVQELTEAIIRGELSAEHRAWLAGDTDRTFQLFFSVANATDDKFFAGIIEKASSASPRELHNSCIQIHSRLLRIIGNTTDQNKAEKLLQMGDSLVAECVLLGRRTFSVTANQIESSNLAMAAAILEASGYEVVVATHEISR
ncbi:MAG: hypothetical protein HUU37_03050 [Bdellovibrionales bacterium]|nr:hypothetical protein [Bdellovibrionales bacterium]